MTDVSALDLDNLREVGSSSFSLAAAVDGPTTEQDGYQVASENGFHLIYVSLSNTIKLESGATVDPSIRGYLIAQDDPTQSRLIGVAFYPLPGTTYSTSATAEYKFEVVEAFNAFSEGVGEATSEDYEREASRNERGETVQEEQDRLQREEEEAETQRLKDASTSIYEEETIRDEVFEDEGGGYAIKFGMRIIKITTGTALYPQVSFKVEEYYITQGLLNNKAKQTWNASTQEQAEAIFDDEKAKLVSAWEEKKERGTQEELENETEIRPYQEVEFYFEPSTYTFQQMMTLQGDSINWDNMPLWRRSLFGGPFNDAYTWTDNGQTLELQDFDTPRLTSEGVEYNPSGAVAFTIRSGWKVTFELKSESRTFMSSDAVDGVETKGDSFEFTMIGGDRLELDIDNESESIRPVLIMVQGREWFSTEEIDDETSLTLIKAEQLMAKAEKGRAYFYVRGDKEGQKMSDTMEPETYEGRAFDKDTWFYLNFQDELSEYQYLNQSSREILSQEVAAEASFVSPNQVASGLGDAVEGIGSGIWSRFKWWIIGGTVVVGGIILLSAYVKARAGREVAQMTQPSAPARSPQPLPKPGSPSSVPTRQSGGQPLPRPGGNRTRM